MGANLMLVAGARPNFVKAAPLMDALADHPRFQVTLVHTGQHYDPRLSDSFFAELGLRAPDVELGAGSGTHAEQTARIMVGFERVVHERAVDLVLVVGDVNSTLACALVAAKAAIPLAHVEAGLRSFDRAMPEEVNRIVTDSLSSVLFTTSADADANLLAEGHPAGQVHLVGNTMIDTLRRHQSVASNIEPLRPHGLQPGGYVLVTLHRPPNVDHPARLAATLAELARAPVPVLFPMHPRTRGAAKRAGLPLSVGALRVTGPVGYLDFLALQAQAGAVLTDSGGIQEETTALGVPCLTFRDNTERPVTITHGTNRLIGSDPRRILPEIEEALAAPRLAGRMPPLWDGHAAERIAAVLEQDF